MGGALCGQGQPHPELLRALVRADGRFDIASAGEVELHRPADLPAFILIKWPAAPSVASPETFDNLVAAVYRVLADARTTLSRMRGDCRTR